MPPPTPEDPGLPRRAVLGILAAGAVAAVAGGCTTGASGHTAGRPPAVVRRPRGVSPDVALAVAAVARIGIVADLLHRTVAHHRGLRHQLAGLAALHAAHLQLLREAVPADRRAAARVPTGHRGRVPRRQQAALAAAVQAERDLRPQLEGLAVRAESGEFARLLAAMSAAVAQQLAAVAPEKAVR